MIYSPFLIISVPIICSFLLAFVTYNTKDHFYDNAILLFSCFIFFTIILEFILRFWRIKINIKKELLYQNYIENTLAICFGFFIVIFCIVDLYVRGPLLFTNPSLYDTHFVTEKYIRYITIMCWSLIPIAFFCTKNKIIKTLFCTTAILFPLIIVDRNRFLSSIYVLIVVFIIINKEKLKEGLNLKRLIKILLLLTITLFSVLMIFSLVGEKRSSIDGLVYRYHYPRLPKGIAFGSQGFIQKSQFFKITNEPQNIKSLSNSQIFLKREKYQTSIYPGLEIFMKDLKRSAHLQNIKISLMKLKNNYLFIRHHNYENNMSKLKKDISQLQKLEFRDGLLNASTPIKWLLIYSSIGIFNFSFLYDTDYRDPDYLNFQLFRIFHPELSRSYNDLAPKPIPFPPLSVCTEFIPFFLYGGGKAVISAFMLVCIMYFVSLCFLFRFPSSIFLLLGFLKISYCCLVLNFGPQFFTFTNLVFFLLMIIMHVVSNSNFFKKIIDSEQSILLQKQLIGRYA